MGVILLYLLIGMMFDVALHPQRPLGLLGTGSPGRPPRFFFLSLFTCACSKLWFTWDFLSVPVRSVKFVEFVQGIEARERAHVGPFSFFYSF